MSITPDVIIHKKLTLAKKLYQRAVTMHNSFSIADKLMSVIVYDLSVETTLNTIVISLDPTKAPLDNFPSLLSQVDSLLVTKNLKPLPDRANILRVHTIRNDAQHDARDPSDNDLNDCRTYIRDFLKKVVNDVWNLDFDKISMLDSIQNTSIKKHLEKAEEALNKKDFKTVVEQSVTAVHRTLNLVGSSITGHFFTSSFRPLVTSDMRGENLQPDRSLTDGIEKMKTTLQFVALGLNYADYVKFKRITGTPTFTIGSEEPVDFNGTKTALDEKDAEFTIVYATDAVISIENRVGNIEKPFT